MHTICIGIGGNVGDTSATIDRALSLMTQQIGNTVAVSSRHQTKPMGDSAGSSFLNAAAVLKTQLQPLDVLQQLHSVEAQCGRERSIHWGPRTLDLDLLLYDDVIIDQPEIVVPHPAMWYRGFVLTPLAEIASDAVHPVYRHTVEALRSRLLRRPLVLQIDPAQLTDLTTDDLRQSIESLVSEDAVIIRLASKQGTSLPADDVFAQLVVTAAKDCSQSPRTQPHAERDFVIRLPADRLLQSLTDLVSAFGV